MESLDILRESVQQMEVSPKKDHRKPATVVKKQATLHETVQTRHQMVILQETMAMIPTHLLHHLEPMPRKVFTLIKRAAIEALLWQIR